MARDKFYKHQHFLIAVVIFPTILSLVKASIGPECELRLSNCTRMVQPFLDDSRYMFPTTMRDVDVMCKVWSRFVDCVRKFMVKCSTEDQRSKFHLAVENSLNTVHAICSSDRYQKDYLENSDCFKKVSVNDCGSYYRTMIQQVSNPFSNDEHICCAFSQFRQCADDLLIHQCGSKGTKLLETSMNYFISRCGMKFYSMAYRCPTAPPPLETNRDSLHLGSTPIPIISTPSVASNVTPYAWSARTVIYTLPTAYGSRTSRENSGAADCLQNQGLFWRVYFPLVMIIWVIFSEQ